MDDIDKIFSQGNLNNIEGSASTIDGVNRSIHVTTGRFSNTAFKAASGQEEISIVSNTCRLAEMIVLSAHKIGGEKTYNDTLFRSRQLAYKYKPNNFINKV